MSHYKAKKFMKKICKNCSLKTSSRFFCVCKKLSTASVENEIFEASYLYHIFNSKAIKICPNQHVHLLRFLFTEDSLNIKKGLELVSRPHCSQNFLINFIEQYYINWPNFITRLCLLPKLFSKMCFVFHAGAFDDVMTFEYLKS